MVDTTQILLYTVVVALTILLIVIGIQVFLILKEIKKMLEKANKMMDDATKLTGSISSSFHEISGFASGIKTVFKVFDVFNKKDPSTSSGQGGEKKNHAK